MSTFASLFTGGGGADLGACNAGYCHAWGVEIDRQVADHARRNGFGVQCADVTDFSRLDLTPLLRPDVLWASPPCQSFSDAKVDKGETEADLKLARAVRSIIWYLTPHTFVLENVPRYEKSESFTIIKARLERCGYDVDVRVLNAADFGVPQNRKRLILRACLGRKVPPIEITHTREATLFTKRWVSWYEAIQDLLPDLRKTQLARWQIEKLEGRGLETMLMSHSNQRMPIVGRNQPSPTVLVANGSTPRAILVSHQTWGLPISDELPSSTVTNSNRSTPKAMLIDGANASGSRYRFKEQPAQTVLASGKSMPRVIEDCRVVQLNVQCLARFQSFPDSYVLPATQTLGCKVIGNAVPPLLARRVLESLKGDQNGRHI